MSEPDRLARIRHVVALGDPHHTDYMLSNRNVAWLLAEIDRLTGERDRLAHAYMFDVRERADRFKADPVEWLVKILCGAEIGNSLKAAATLAEHDRKARETKP